MLEKIREVLGETLSIEPGDVTPEASFREDLGIDSLDLFELVLKLEDEYGFEIPAEELEKIKTVGDFLKYLDENGVKP